jgi:UDP-3-O-[3-hydroxymyristoyl] glucosamine N-acyltransferase
MLDRVIHSIRVQRLTPRPFAEATTGSVTYLTGDTEDVRVRASNSSASLIICSDKLSNLYPHNGASFVQVPDPKLFFARLVMECWRPMVRGYIDPTAIIDPNASIHPTVSVGAYSVLMGCQLDANTRVDHHVCIEHGTIGKNCRLQSQCTIGVEGLSHVRNEDGRYEDFPNIGGLIIEDNVWIASQANVDRGTLGDTVIMRGSKISKCVNVGHNSRIGMHTFIAGNSNIGGGARVGNYCFLGMGTIVKNGVTIGDKSCTGMGSIVVSDIPDGVLARGNPAKVVGEWKVNI